MEAETNYDYHLRHREDLRRTFQEIYTALKKYQPNVGPALTKKHHIENHILGELHKVMADAELFWEGMAWNKDIFSFKFGSRLFPKFGADDNAPPPPPESTTKPKPSVFKATKEELVNSIKTKYDVRDSIRKTLNAEYIDEGSTSSKDKSPFYHALDLPEYYNIVSQDTLNAIFQLCLRHKLYVAMLGLFCSLVTNRYFCHLVLSDFVLECLFKPAPVFDPSGVSTETNPFLDPEYLEIVHHCLFYGFYLLYKEECIIKACVNLHHRFVFSISQAAKIPGYNGALENNPYIPLTLSGDLLHASNVPSPDYIVKPIKAASADRGFYSIWSFKERFAIFTGGIFDSLQLDKVYFGGSLIPACAIRNPLEKLFYQPLRADEDLNFEKEVLPDAPGYMVHLNRIATLKRFWKAHTEKLEAYFDEYFPSKKVIGRDLTEDVNQAELEDRLSDIDIMIDVLDDADFDKKVMHIIDVLKANLCKKHQLSEIQDEQLKLIKISTKKSYKYYVSGSLMPRSLEIFRLFGAHPIGGVSRFHFPAVRGIYDGNDVYVLPSTVSYANTGIFIDYKWMSSAKDTKDLVLKYFIRGGTCLLNEKEHQALAKHIKENLPQWGVLLAYATLEQALSINNPIFRPRMIKHGFYANIANALTPLGGASAIRAFNDYQYVIDDHEFLNRWRSPEWKSRMGFTLTLRFPSGHTQPFGAWRVGAYLHSLGRSKKYNS